MLFVCAVIGVLLGTAHSQCTRLPTDDQIETLLLSIIIGNVKGDKVVLLISHHFTCIAPGQKMGELQGVSIAVVFNVTTDMGVTDTRRQQIQLECTTNNVNNYRATTNSLEQNPPAVAFTLTTRKDCFLCVPSGPADINVDADANCAGESYACMHV